MLLDKIPVRVRLSLGHAIWMGLIFIAIGIGVYRMVEDSVLQSLDATLLTSAKAIRDAQSGQDKPLGRRQDNQYLESMLDDFFGDQRVLIRPHAQLVDMSGNIKTQYGDVKVRLPVTTRAFARAKNGEGTYENFQLQNGVTLRQFTLPVMRSGRFSGELIQVGASMTSSMQTLKSLKRMLWITLTLGLAMTVIFGYLLTRWSFQPVERITHAVARLGVNDDFDKRLKLPPANDELRLLVQTFNEMIDRIEDAFSRLRRFSGDVSHELRTPLAVLRGEAELALRRERSPEEYKSALGAIVREAAQMSTIVEDLLLLARAQGRSIEVDKNTVELDSFLADLKQSLAPQFESKDLSFELVAQGENQVKMSSGYMMIVLKNLLLNACKHSAAGQVVRLSVESTFGELRFVVEDQGEGIPEESLPYIFDTFYRADTARNRGSGGVGIGLSLAKALVQLHGGQISVDSKPGSGAQFTIVLPQMSGDTVLEQDRNQRRTTAMVEDKVRPQPPF